MCLPFSWRPACGRCQCPLCELAPCFASASPSVLIRSARPYLFFMLSLRLCSLSTDACPPQPPSPLACVTPFLRALFLSLPHPVFKGVSSSQTHLDDGATKLFTSKSSLISAFWRCLQTTHAHIVCFADLSKLIKIVFIFRHIYFAMGVSTLCLPLCISSPQFLIRIRHSVLCISELFGFVLCILHICEVI